MADQDRLVHLVDDDESIRRSASFMLRSLHYRVQVYESGAPLLAAELAPGCVLLDVRMPGMDGIEVHQKLKEKGVFLPVIIMTGHGDINLAVQAMKAGAVDFLEKPFSRAGLLAALDDGFARLRADGEDRMRAETAQVRLAALTPREREVLEGLVRGHPNKAIAFDLGISPRTVEIHRANLMAKLGVGSLSEALRLAFAGGVGSDAPAA